MKFDLVSLRNGYREGQFTPADVIREAYRRIREKGERPVWITVIPEAESIARAEALGNFREDLPLYGIPFAVKDNIDLAGIPTTAGCPDYAYTPAATAPAVARLLDAGAIPLGKTNLDQFATGLVGVRSPYGACSSVFGEQFISGGSSSGSAVAVAVGLAAFSLGTDTAGSGRVPAALNGLVGLKPTIGAIRTEGVVPACRSLDCVSIFAHTCADAAAVLSVAAAPQKGQTQAWSSRNFRFGVPAPEHLRFFGNQGFAAAWDAAIAHMEALGGIRTEFDYGPFNEVAQLLYSGPWVAERLAAIDTFLAAYPNALHPVTERIISGARSLTAVDVFKAMYRVAELSQATQEEWKRMDFMLLPTAGTRYTHEEVEADPFGTNTNLGYYTNFVNLLDLAAVAVPTPVEGFGVTLIGPARSDSALLAAAAVFHGESSAGSYCPQGYVPVAVCGAHLTGMPLNWQLTQAGAYLIEATSTSPDYKLYALKGTVPAKPGLEYVPAGGGASIEVEVWAVPETTFGPFVAAIPPPLGIGSCILSSGRVVKSFICEPFALPAARDITVLGGWRGYVATLNP